MIPYLSGTNPSSQRGGVGRTRLVTAGGSGGGRPPPQGGTGPQYRQDMNEQIVMALTRLQQDMSSVLTRLNTLETLTVAQHHVRLIETNTYGIWLF